MQLISPFLCKVKPKIQNLLRKVNMSLRNIDSLSKQWGDDAFSSLFILDVAT